MNHTSERTPLWQERRTHHAQIEPLLRQTHDQEPRARREALHALCPCSTRAEYPEVWDRVFEMVDDQDPKVRGDVLHVVCDGSPRSREAEVVALLEKLSHDADQKLRRRARKILASYRAGGHLNVL